MRGHTILEQQTVAGLPASMSLSTVASISRRYLDGELLSVSHQRISSQMDEKLESPIIADYADVLAGRGIYRVFII